MITCLLLFDQTADAVSVAIGVGSIFFLILFFLILWFDTRSDTKRWELRERMDKKDLELQQAIWDTQRESRQMVYDAKSELRKEISDTERRLREALAKARAALTPDLERELMDANWASLLAESRARAERARERLKRRNQPPDDIDEGLKRLEQTIANLTPSDNEALQRADASLKRILENLKRIREMQRGTDALLEGE